MTSKYLLFSISKVAVFDVFDLKVSFEPNSNLSFSAISKMGVAKSQ